MYEPDVHNASEISSPELDQHYMEEPFPLMVLRLSVEVTLAFLGLLGNILVVFVISRQKKSRWGIRLFIWNLALADIGILAVNFPFAVVKEQLPMKWPFGKVICVFVYPMAEVFHAVSVWSIAAIAIERYRNIIAVTPSTSYNSTKAIKVGLVAIWLVSFLLVSLPLLFFVELVEDDSGSFCFIDWSHVMHSIYVLSLTVFWYLLPLAIIIFTYVKISRQIHKSNKFHRASLKLRSPKYTDSEDLSRLTDEKKILKQNSRAKKILTPIVLVFSISMVPLNVLRVTLLYWEDLAFEKYFLVIYHICVIGVLINSASDPLIYSIVSKDFRSDIKASFLFTKRVRNFEFKSVKKDKGQQNIPARVSYFDSKRAELLQEQQSSKSPTLLTFVV